MIRHIAMLRWKDGTTDATVDAIEEALRPMPEIMPFIAGYELGRDLGLNSSHHFVVIADFTSEDDYRAYAAQPEHKDVIDRLIAPVLDSIARVQVAL